jgi:hypothetical protein
MSLKSLKINILNLYKWIYCHVYNSIPLCTILVSLFRLSCIVVYGALSSARLPLSFKYTRFLPWLTILAPRDIYNKSRKRPVSALTWYLTNVRTLPFHSTRFSVVYSLCNALASVLFSRLIISHFTQLLLVQLASCLY